MTSRSWALCRKFSLIEEENAHHGAIVGYGCGYGCGCEDTQWRRCSEDREDHESGADAGQSKYLGELGVPSLPGSFLDVLSYFSRDEANNDNGSDPNGNGNSNGTIQMSEFTNQSQAPSQNSNQQKRKPISQSQQAGPSGTSTASGSGAAPATDAATNGSNSAGNNASVKGKGKETPPVNPLNISGMSRM